MSRIKLDDTFNEVMIKMAEGNPGGLTVMIQLMKNEAEIDPDCWLAPLGSILFMDTLGIYGSEIWILYKDICGEKLPVMIAILRAVQLGFYSQDDLIAAIKSHGKIAVDIEGLAKKVKERLPAFKIELS